MPTPPTPVIETSPVDLMAVLFANLAPAEREAAFQRIAAMRAEYLAGHESDTRRMIRSLRRVGEVAGVMPPTLPLYRKVAPRLIREGEDIATPTALYEHFDRTWAKAVEALGLSETDSPRRIEARFRSRETGKVWRYTERQLAETLDRCSAYFVARFGLPAGARYAPLVAEFDHWREREHELARARGDHAYQLPSSSPYRRRYGDWETALQHFGFTSDQLAERLAQQVRPVPPCPRVEKPTPEGLPVATLADRLPAGLPVSDEQAVELRDAYRALPPRTRFVLTARLGLDGHTPLRLKDVAEPLGLHLSRIPQVQHGAVGELAERVGVSADQVVEVLRRMSA